tara:strand:- start:5153 stop:5590 length:438 start_codon:yes stop_codon:yes gene_type:complete
MLSSLTRNQFIKRTFSNNALGSPSSPQGTETFFTDLIGQGMSKTAIGAGTGIATVGLTVYNFGPSVAMQNEKLERFKQEQTQKFEINDMQHAELSSEVTDIHGKINKLEDKINQVGEKVAGMDTKLDKLDEDMKYIRKRLDRRWF